MFREMRLKENELTRDEAERILKNGSYGVLALEGDESWPYAVPVNFTYEDEVIYFHGAIEGHKLDSIARNQRVSLCVVEKSEIVPEAFNDLYVSAIAFGRAEVVTEDAEKTQILERILQKYSADFMEDGRRYIDSTLREVCAVKVKVEHLTAKKGI